MEEEKPEPVSVPVKKENDNKKKWMKRIWLSMATLSLFIIRNTELQNSFRNWLEWKECSQSTLITIITCQTAVLPVCTSGWTQLSHPDPPSPACSGTFLRGFLSAADQWTVQKAPSCVFQFHSWRSPFLVCCRTHLWWRIWSCVSRRLWAGCRLWGPRRLSSVGSTWNFGTTHRWLQLIIKIEE